MSNKKTKLFMKQNELIVQLFKNAESAVKVFNTLERRLNALGFEVPECYDHTRKGGFMGVGFTKNDLLLKQINEIVQKKDPQFGTKSEKYEEYATGKYFVLINQMVMLSEQRQFVPIFKDGSKGTPVSVAGGVAFQWNNKYVFTSFSGRSSKADQAILMLSAYKSGIIDSTGIRVFYEITKNPFLESGIFGAIISEMK